MKALIALALAASLAACGLSIHALRVARNAGSHSAPAAERVGADWTDADEAAVQSLLSRTGQQIGGYLASLKRGNQRHAYSERQLLEALRRQRVAADWRAATNAVHRLAD